ncbi:MAG: hypothetical protein OEV92_07760 [Nitrospinota bacterium]|nr:hypothetical protein [Nitrospinota bacterium]
MGNWAIEKKAAATLILLLLGAGYLAGLANLALTVGLKPEDVKSRYMAKPPAQGLEFLLDQTEQVSREKLAHIAHAHMIPYTLVFALCSFFVVHFRWPPWAKIIFLTVFALSIPMDFVAMALTRYVYSFFYILILASGAVFGSCLASTILWSMGELWLFSKK